MAPSLCGMVASGSVGNLATVRTPSDGRMVRGLKKAPRELVGARAALVGKRCSTALLQ
jgi:hypothetical protein